MPDDDRFTAVTRELIEVGRRFDQRSWVQGTSGNLSAVVSRDPLRVAITASALAKGSLSADDFLVVDGSCSVIGDSRSSSAETPLHVAIVRSRGAGAVLHTHSIWSTVLSERHSAHGGIAIEGYEMLKGLEGVTSHHHREWLPIFENDQDMPALAQRLTATLEAEPAIHGFLLRGHGLYTWGADVARAARHIEIIEFLLEVVGRQGGH